MNYEDLTPEQQEMVKACRITEELAALAEKFGTKLSDKQLKAIAGGICRTDCPMHGGICVVDNSCTLNDGCSPYQPCSWLSQCENFMDDIPPFTPIPCPVEE